MEINRRRQTRMWLLAMGLGALLLLVALSAPDSARADDGFIMCPSGRSGVATAVTSCAFADNVRRGYLAQGGPTVIAYSPVTDKVYSMTCVTGYLAHFISGPAVISVKCFGGIDAEVVIW